MSSEPPSDPVAFPPVHTFRTLDVTCPECGQGFDVEAPRSEYNALRAVAVEREVVRAMQARLTRNPLSDLLVRKPWRASHRPKRLREVWSWLWVAHDCQDPVVGCSCAGGYRWKGWMGLGPESPSVPRPPAPTAQEVTDADST